MSQSKAAGLAIGFFLAFILAFFYVPQWLIVGADFGSRALRVWLATGWVVAVLSAASYASLRITTPAP